MFDLCDWNDGNEAQSLSESLVSSPAQGTATQKETGSSSRKKRLKRTRQLLDILRTLETPRDRETLHHPELHKAHPQKKHKQEQTEPGAPCLPGSAPAPEGHGSPPTPSDSLTQHISRKQWRNKLKNKRKNKNKFKPDRVPRNRGELQETAGEERTEQSGSVRQGGCTAVLAPRSGTVKDSGVVPSPAAGAPSITLLERRKLHKLRKILHTQGKARALAEDDGDDEVVKDLPEDRSATLRSRMEQRLSSARFRYINQQLYTSDSDTAHNLFHNDPEAFTLYHSGFSQQVQRWPVNPIMDIIKYVKNRPASLVVADFGCGDALLARSVRNQVHSFDLVALNEHVTVCDIKKVPLSDETIDIAVFCLSLMGTNFIEFLQEANRVLKEGGVLLVAEVSSRFEDVRQFLSAMSQLGFKSVAKSTDSSHFFMFEFSKSGSGRDCVRHPGLALKPCLYKKR
ncbi:ribosomal RNA-processing protein 8 [Pelodytes ibericus]